MGFFGKAWRGFDGEDKMTEEDRITRAGDQARAAIFGGDPFASSPDEDGDATGGCYNMDYPDSWHNKQNEKLSNDPNYADEVARNVRSLLEE
jgi:hypothetical protein